MITRAHVLPYVGQRVVVQTRDGTIHHGILHSVSNDGIYVRGIQGQPRLTQGTESPTASLLADLPPSGEVNEAFWPFFFFPWFWIGAFWPWFWW